MVTDIYAVTLMAFGFTAQSAQARAHLHRDLRAETGTQDLVPPLNLVYVANGALSKH
jgi:hypothetical protein